jgi:glycerol-3-phosphate dehydrogenase
MRKEVLVIGGGATGTGVVRDLALRGVDCALLEMGDYCHGASGANHGLLHSGGRYAVQDPCSARECATENRVLRRIAPFCIEDTGGLFVSLPADDPKFGDDFTEACRGTAVEARELTPREALEIEPGLNGDLTRCFQVRDGSLDPFALVQANVEQARECGASVLNHARVTALGMEDGRLERVEYQDRRDGSRHEVLTEVVVNAAGAWASEVARMAGVELSLRMDQGSMLVLDGRVCRNVVNHLRPPSNGDIAVPNHTSTILGTTSRPLFVPEAAAVTAEDARLLMRELTALLPALREGRAIRAYCGVRPLSGNVDGREASRSFSILRKEGAENMLHVVGGKLTTYRLMAEKVADQACRLLGGRGACRTHLEEICPGPPPSGKGIARSLLYSRYGGRAASVPRGDDRLVCTCEQVLRSEVEWVLGSKDVLTLADVMRRTRAGMGYCQGLDCALHVLEMMVEKRGMRALPLLTDFLGEREKGRPPLAGEQSRQELLGKHLLNGVYGLGGEGP